MKNLRKTVMKLLNCFNTSYLLALVPSLTIHSANINYAGKV